MKTVLKAGVERGECRVFAHWKGQTPCTLHTADTLEEFSLQIVDHTKQRRLVSLQGAFAARLLCILDERLRTQRDCDFNCFAAVDTIAYGEPIRSDVHWRRPLGLVRSMDELPPALEPPFRFQMYGEYQMPTTEDAQEWVTTEGILHEGLVLARSGDELVVFHKPGPLRPHISSWEEAVARYRRSWRIHYGALTDR